MTRIARLRVALAGMIAFAIVSGTCVSISHVRGQVELGPEPEARKLNGKKLFETETFGGNGRTCQTCHSKRTGTLTLEDVQLIIKKADPDDPFLIHDALDDDGVGTTRVEAHATIRLTIPLPPWVSLADQPGASHVDVFRGIPSTRNTPALDPILQHDGRAATVQEQALGAIHDHYQNAVEPTAAELDAIAGFQQTAPQFFSSNALRRFAAGGPPPELPPGITPAEQRGRTFLVDAPFDPPSKVGICALCHGGPMLDAISQAHVDFVVARGFRLRPGVRFFNTGVNIVNAPNNPIRTWIIDDGVNPVVTLRSPDLGLLLHPTLALHPSHPPLPPPFAVPRAFFAENFKIPTLWGVKDTAPYFHDNGAKTLRDAVAHYQRFFNVTEAQDPVGSESLGGFVTLTDDDVDDIVAYLKVLGPNRTGR
jgi:cytochrome c peroxidase